MGGSTKEKRLKLFKIFSQNLEWVKENPSIRFEPDFKDAYMCPLCLKLFYELDLSSDVKNQLTIEHIPPESLGGKPKTLTCKNCNSKAGHDLDKQLLNTLLESDFEEFLPNSKIRTKFELNGNKVNGEVKIDGEGKLVLDFRTQNSNPKQAAQFMSDLTLSKRISDSFSGVNGKKIFEPIQQTPKFRFSKPKKGNIRKAEVALLRIAYLFAFSEFGHGFLLNPALSLVRKQILNPDQSVISKPFWVKYNFSDDWTGINLIREPKELRCFLIIFKLKTDSAERKFAIALPGTSDPGSKVYNNIEKILCKDGSGFHDVQIDHLGSFNYLEKKEYAFDSHAYWKKINKS